MLSRHFANAAQACMKTEAKIIAGSSAMGLAGLQAYSQTLGHPTENANNHTSESRSPVREVTLLFPPQSSIAWAKFDVWRNP